MRSVFILFKEASRAEIAQYFDTKFMQNGTDWIRDGSAYIGFYDDTEIEFEPELLERLRTFSGRKEVVAAVADISGKIPGDQEAISFCLQVLGDFSGWAMDDYSSHLWSIEEIKSKSLHAGHPFFDYRGWSDEKAKKELTSP